MNKLLILLLMTSSMMFFFMETPLSMGFILMIQTILTVLISGMLSFNFWYPYILFMIMIGGMLILFIYISSLSSNLKFNFINKKKIILMVMLLMLILMIISKMKFYLMFNNELINIMNMEMENNLFLKMSMNKLYNKPTNWMMIMMINYLLLTLLIVVKIININMGPLRKLS
uniref:NADH-ubiquinone oxidoreductase chain 6 n=1 Tax=Metallus mai TaxID=2782261 RepID=A0A7T6C1K4_9HYME|nr:NADH dehydrogenase subunit 6 [Metallus mai]